MYLVIFVRLVTTQACQLQCCLIESDQNLDVWRILCQCFSEHMHSVGHAAKTLFVWCRMKLLNAAVFLPSRSSRYRLM